MYAPPQTLNLSMVDDSGNIHIGLYVNGYRSEIDMEAMRRTFMVDESQRIPVGLLLHGESYRLLGLFETDVHLFGPLDSSHAIYLLGADRLGRDVLSRVMYGAHISLSIGLIGVEPRHPSHSRRHIRLLRRLGGQRDPARH